VFIIMFALLLALIAGCDRDATVVSRNISKDADQFKVRRRVIFYNAITDQIMFEMVGNLSIDTSENHKELAVTVKLGENEYRKHYLGLSDNVTYIVEQLDYSDVSRYHYELVFKPQSILPATIDIE